MTVAAEVCALAFFVRVGWLVNRLDFDSSGVKSENPECLDPVVEDDT